MPHSSNIRGTFLQNRLPIKTNKQWKFTLVKKFSRKFQLPRHCSIYSILPKICAMLASEIRTPLHGWSWWRCSSKCHDTVNNRLKAKRQSELPNLVFQNIWSFYLICWCSEARPFPRPHICHPSLHHNWKCQNPLLYTSLRPSVWARCFYLATPWVMGGNYFEVWIDLAQKTLYYSSNLSRG